CSIQRNGESLGDAYLTQSSYDIRGNLLSITDSLGRVAFTHNYDLLNRPLRITSIDAGARTSVFNAIGALIEYRDSKGSFVLHEYDVLNRPTRLWALNDSSQTSITLREQINYGDGGTRTQPAAEREANRALNRLGRPKQHYDEAGLIDFRRYDFK